MPIYEYACKRCDARFEKLAKSMNDAQPIPCPECGSMKTVRAMSVFAVSSSTTGASKASHAAPGMCGRCGGPGPCATPD